MQLDLQFADLPPYRVRRSARARRPSVSVCLHDGVVLTLPQRFDERRVPAALDRPATQALRRTPGRAAGRHDRPAAGHDPATGSARSLAGGLPGQRRRQIEGE